MKKILLLNLLLLLFAFANAQEKSCSVLLNELSGYYKGKCQNGLAEGKGKAKGKDSYVGYFKDGLPHGKGTYVYSNGDKYTGNWKKGKKDGKGKFNYSLNNKKYKLIGYWQQGEYKGKVNPDKKYNINSSSGILYHKVEETENELETITVIIKSALTNFKPSDLEVNVSSGQVMMEGKAAVISNYFYPLNCEVTYSIAMGASQRKTCRFLIDFLEKGSYKITLSND